MREINDLYVTALLRLRGHEPAKVVGDGRRCTWHFDSTPALEADLSAYHNGTMQVSVRDFSEVLRSVKGQAIHVAREAVAGTQ